MGKSPAARRHDEADKAFRRAWKLLDRIERRLERARAKERKRLRQLGDGTGPDAAKRAAQLEVARSEITQIESLLTELSGLISANARASSGQTVKDLAVSVAAEIKDEAAEPPTLSPRRRNRQHRRRRRPAEEGTTTEAQEPTTEAPRSRSAEAQEPAAEAAESRRADEPAGSRGPAPQSPAPAAAPSGRSPLPERRRLRRRRRLPGPRPCPRWTPCPGTNPSRSRRRPPRRRDKVPLPSPSPGRMSRSPPRSRRPLPSAEPPRRMSEVTPRGRGDRARQPAHRTRGGCSRPSAARSSRRRRRTWKPRRSSRVRRRHRLMARGRATARARRRIRRPRPPRPDGGRPRHRRSHARPRRPIRDCPEPIVEVSPDGEASVRPASDASAVSPDRLRACAIVGGVSGATLGRAAAVDVGSTSVHLLVARRRRRAGSNPSSTSPSC